MDNALSLVRSHLDWFIAHAPAQGYGPDDNAMWMSSIDLHTGRSPKYDRPAGIEKRCYRWIEAPGGSNCYWDLPLLAAAHAVAQLTGDAQYGQAADAYVRDFLERCVAGNGMFLWGNHYYYDAASGQVVWFTDKSPPKPVDLSDEDGKYHETRPLPVAWDLFWRLDAAATERSIRAQGDRHVVDAKSGEHNRHADRKRGHAFLESGGILAETLCWLGSRSEDAALIDLAKRIVRFNFEHRNPRTGLISNSPTHDRWDMHTVTSEVGMWAGCLMRCFDLSGRSTFADMASEALSAWLDCARDAAAGRFYGKLRIADATPNLGPKKTIYQPWDYCDPWEPLFPAHDYPMPCAEACLRCFRHTGDRRFLTGVERWADVVSTSLPARRGRGGYAEHYGRCIHFLLEAAEVCGRDDWRALAQRVADEAIDVLQVGDRFRTHPGENRCDAVDGLGFLFLALLRLETGRDPDLMGLAF